MKPSWSRLLLSVFIAAALVAFVKLRPRSEDSEPLPGMPRAKPSTEAPRSEAPKPSEKALARAQGQAPQDRQPASLPERSPAELFIELLRRGDWSPQPAPGGIKTGFIGKPIEGAARNPASALEIGRQAARQLGVSPEQLSLDHSIADTQTGLQTVHQFGQWVGGYEVYGGDLRVIARRSDAAVYLINSSLKPVDEVPSDPRAIDRAAARGVVESHYRDRGGRVVNPEPPQAVIFADSRPVELAWVFNVEVTSPKATKVQALVGASSRRVVHESVILRH